MKRSIIAGTLVAFLLPLTAQAGVIDRACMSSQRQAANRSLCGCIQQVADQTLKNAEQRRAAKFFRNPDEAHKVWMSKTNRDDEFWKRYKAFGAQAEAACTG